MGIFEQFGIKEVANVCIYSIQKKDDDSGEIYYVPSLYLDTLKISSTEKTADNVWAEGGYGNERLISWDFGRKINIQLEDAVCSPASMSMCWGGVFSSDWKDGHVAHKSGIAFNQENPVERISRMEKAYYPKADRLRISHLLPHLDIDEVLDNDILAKSSLVDGTEVNGFGYIGMRPYKWRLAIESQIKSISQIPDKFFDIYGKSYKINKQTTIAVKSPNAYEDFKYEVCYKINEKEQTKTKPDAVIIIDKSEETQAAAATENLTEYDDIKQASYLKIRVYNDDTYRAFLGLTPTDISTKENTFINVEQFKGLDMWLRFSSINELIYFIITKYKDNVEFIKAGTYNPLSNEKSNNPGAPWELLEKADTTEEQEKEGELWCYVNPKTMTPYEDDYWFYQGEPYLINSLTLSTPHKKLNAKRIVVKEGVFPGAYMIEGETFIRDRDTHKDQRMQIKFPLCKIKSDQTLALEAGGDPVVFNFDVEVAMPRTGVAMEITTYDVDKKTININGQSYEKDGSTKILSK